MKQTASGSVNRPHHSSHMSKRPPRNIAVSAPPMPDMHATQRADFDEITDWGEWVSAEGGQLDPLFVPPQVKRTNFAYQWISKSVLNSEDTIIKRRLMTFYRSGWKPVPGERGKGYFFLPGEAVPATIEVGGQILVEKPKHIEDHARQLNERAAKTQLRDKLVEVGMASPENVRQKLVSVKVDENPDYMQAPGGENSAVPE